MSLLAWLHQHAAMLTCLVHACVSEGVGTGGGPRPMFSYLRLAFLCALLTRAAIVSLLAS